mgnify:CR=1 FL=1
MDRKSAKLVQAVIAAGGEIIGWQEAKDSEGGIHLIPRIRISPEQLVNSGVKELLEDMGQFKATSNKWKREMK